MGRKHKKHEEHENHERYLVTYSDLITLLLAFFIILYAMSDVNEEKFDTFSKSLSVAFHNGSNNIIDLGLENRNSNTIRSKLSPQEMQMMAAISENNDLRKMKKEIDKKIKENNLQGQMSTNLTEDGLKIILTNEILFEPGKAELKSDYRFIIDSISGLVKGVENKVQISGYTDNVPISTPEFPSNWDLSSARSLSVLKEMLKTDKGLDPKRFSAAGYGEYQPIASNTTAEGRKENRRVEILIERKNTQGSLKSE